MTTRADYLAVVQAGDLEKIDRYLDAEPDLLDSRTDAGLPPVLLALYHGQPAAARALIERGVALDLYSAAAAGEHDRVATVLAADPGAINSHAPDGFTALGLAAFFGHAALVDWLLASGADPNVGAANSLQVRPLRSAAANRDHALAHTISAALLDYGADANARKAGGFTPLHEAALSGKTDLARALLAHGADPGLAADDGTLPADLAARHQHHAVLALLSASTPALSG